MNHCWYSRLAPLIVLAAMVGGCGTVPSGAAVGADRKARGRSAAAALAAISDRALESQAQAHAHFAMGVMRDLNGEQDLALEEFLNAARADLGNEQLVSDVARRLLQTHQTKKAVEQAADLLARAVTQPRAPGSLYMLLGAAYGELGKTNQAIQANRMAIRRAPLLLGAYRNLVRVYLQEKKPRAAAQVLVEAVRRRSADLGFVVDVAGLYASVSAQLGKESARVKPRVVEALNRAAKLKAAKPDLLLKLADGYNAMGEFAKAKVIYLQLLKQDPPMPAVREKLTDLYIRSGDRQGAREQLENIRRDTPTNPQVYYLLGTLAADEKDYARAAENYEKTILLSPEFESVYYELAGVEITENKPTDALAVLDKARARFKQSFVMEFYTALAYSRLKQYAEALHHFTTAEVVATATNPKLLNQAFYFQLAATCERNKDYAEAEKHFQKCLELAPDNAEAMNYLGYMWVERGVNLAKARALIEKAVKSEPDNAAFLDSLGWVLFKLNQPREALPHLLKAIQHSQEPDPVLYDHLGDIYADLKQPSQAREAWRKSLALEPSAQVEQKLKNPAGTGQSPR
ncbi:MAG: tetratricopeptide repeat protein [Limisphaerales bacterium]